MVAACKCTGPIWKEPETGNSWKSGGFPLRKQRKVGHCTMQLSWWVLPLLFIPPRLPHTHTNGTLFCLALAPRNPQLHETSPELDQALGTLHTHCDCSNGITGSTIGVATPSLVAILKLEQHKTQAHWYLLIPSHVRTLPTCCHSWGLEGPQTWCPNWSTETTHIWLADNWAVWGLLSLLQIDGKLVPPSRNEGRAWWWYQAWVPT